MERLSRSTFSFPPLLAGSPSSHSPNIPCSGRAEDIRQKVRADLACLELDYLFRRGLVPTRTRLPHLAVTSSPVRSQASSPPGSPFALSFREPSSTSPASERWEKRKPGTKLGGKSHHEEPIFGPGLVEVGSDAPRFRIPDYGKRDYGDGDNYDDDDDDDATTISTSILSDTDSPGGFSPCRGGKTVRHCSTAYLHYQECGCEYTVTHSADARRSNSHWKDRTGLYRSAAPSAESLALPAVIVTEPSKPTGMAGEIEARSTSTSTSLSSSYAQTAPSCEGSISSSSEPDRLQAMIAELGNLANPPDLYTAADWDGAESRRNSDASLRFQHEGDAWSSTKKKSRKPKVMTTHSLPGICNNCRLFEEWLPDTAAPVASSRPSPRRDTVDTMATVPTLVMPTTSDPQSSGSSRTSSDSSSSGWPRRLRFKSAVEHIVAPKPVMATTADDIFDLELDTRTSTLDSAPRVKIGSGIVDDIVYDNGVNPTLEGGIDGHRLAELLAIEQQQQQQHIKSLVETNTGDSGRAAEKSTRQPPKNVRRATRDLTAFLHDFVLAGGTDREDGSCDNDDDDESDDDEGFDDAHSSFSDGGGDGGGGDGGDSMYDADEDDDDETFSHGRALVSPKSQPLRQPPPPLSFVFPKRCVDDHAQMRTAWPSASAGGVCSADGSRRPTAASWYADEVSPRTQVTPPVGWGRVPE